MDTPRKFNGYVDAIIQLRLAEGGPEWTKVFRDPPPIEHCNATLVVHPADPEKVFTESEVRAAFSKLMRTADSGELQTGYKVEFVEVGDLRQALQELGITL